MFRKFPLKNSLFRLKNAFSTVNKPAGPYSFSRKITSGEEVLYVSGQLGIDSVFLKKIEIGK